MSRNIGLDSVYHNFIFEGCNMRSDDTYTEKKAPNVGKPYATDTRYSHRNVDTASSNDEVAEYDAFLREEFEELSKG